MGDGTGDEDGIVVGTGDGDLSGCSGAEVPPLRSMTE